MLRRAPALGIAALVAIWGAHRGRPSLALLLPAAGAVAIGTFEHMAAAGLTTEDPVGNASVLAWVWSGIVTVPWVAALLGLGLLPAMRGMAPGPSRRWVLPAGVLWPLLGIGVRLAHERRPLGSAVLAAVAMALAGVVARRDPSTESASTRAPLAYATFATLVAAASVPDLYLYGFQCGGVVTPEQKCLITFARLAVGERASLWALCSTPLALWPLWAEARRADRLRSAASASAVLVLAALGLSMLSLTALTRFYLGPSCQQW